MTKSEWLLKHSSAPAWWKPGLIPWPVHKASIMGFTFYSRLARTHQTIVWCESEEMPQSIHTRMYKCVVFHVHVKLLRRAKESQINKQLLNLHRRGVPEYCDTRLCPRLHLLNSDFITNPVGIFSFSGTKVACGHPGYNPSPLRIPAQSIQWFQRNKHTHAYKLSWRFGIRHPSEASTRAAT